MDASDRQTYVDALVGPGAALTGRLVVPGDRDYDDARFGWNPRFSKFPLAVIYCRDPKDVVNAVRWARRRNVEFRIRSGGHGLEGWSLIDGGIIIDVSPMTRVEVDTRARTATVQTGVAIGDLLATLAPHGLTVPFGDSASVGVGGITLGGGIGVLARTMGLISDNLTRVEMVVAAGDRDASLVVADVHENPDLYWACRGGGGGNFGVATSFTFALHSVPAEVPIYDVYWPWDDPEAVLEAWQRLAPSADDRLGSMLELFSRSVGRHRMHGVFLGPETDLRQILLPLLAVGAPDVTLKTVPYLEATRFLTDSPAARHAVDRSPVNIKFSSAWAMAPLPADVVALCRRYLENERADAFSMFFLNMGGAMRRLAAATTAFPHREASFYLEWDARWTRPASDGAAATAVEMMRLALQPFVTGSYVNVPDPGIPDWQDAYFGANATRLRRVKKQYDPTNVFRFEQSIPPA